MSDYQQEILNIQSNASYKLLVFPRLDPSIIECLPVNWEDLQYFRFFNACNSARTSYYRKNASTQIKGPKIKTPTNKNLERFSVNYFRTIGVRFILK